MIFICNYCHIEFKRPPSSRTFEKTFCSRPHARKSFMQTRNIRFWNKIKKMENGCWEWQFAKTSYGYGEFCSQLAHRFSYELTFGKIPKNKVILHSCDNPPCVNPAHLVIGTQQDNIRDASSKGRINRGEDRPQHKLTILQVLDIRKRYPKETQKSLAKEYKVHQKNIFNIVHRLRWKHI